jgi:aryl-alcohol dehydrogenase-like predicted oxidoreductase
MEYRSLGRTGVQVSALCVGAWQFGQRTSKEESFQIINQSLDAGVNFFDTASSYGQGRSEEILGEAFKQNGQRHNIVLATKFSHGVSRNQIIHQCEASLRRLQTDYIDLYQFHSSHAHIPIDESLRALDDLIRAGKVRYTGSSNFTAWQIVEALWAAKELGLNRLVSSQPAYNLLDRQVERELLPMARSYGLGVLPWSPLAQGFLTGKYRRNTTRPADGRLQESASGTQTGPIDVHFVEAAYDLVELLAEMAAEKEASISQLALAWCLQQPGITSPIIGPRTLEQLHDNLGALAVTLTAEDERRIDAIIPPGRMIVPYHRANTEPRPRWS